MKVLVTLLYTLARSFICLLACSLASKLMGKRFVFEMNASFSYNCEPLRIHFIDKYVGSEWVGEWANKWAQQSTRAKRAVQNKRMNEHCEKTSEQISKWPSSFRVKFHKLLCVGPFLHNTTRRKGMKLTRRELGCLLVCLQRLIIFFLHTALRYAHSLATLNPELMERG